MQNGQQSIFDVFNGNKHFIVPKYQRAYAWSDKQLTDFLDDLKNQREDCDYFFGTILFQNNGNLNGFEEIEIVDGQQRLTTFVIFMNVLLKILKEKNDQADYLKDIRRYIKDKDFYKLELANMDDEFFKTYVLDGYQADNVLVKTPSQRKLYNARRFFKHNLNKMDLSELKDYKSKIENTKVLIYSVNDAAEATLIFETTNDRGKTLTNLEKT
ncbi:MAG: DUF262 domain-containing protein, partial [bacterium]|nr:DUF262 domain-containing protein [bacterium]